MVDSEKWLLYAIDQSRKHSEYRNFYMPMKNKKGTVKTYAYSLNRFMIFLVQQHELENTESFKKLISYDTKTMVELIKSWIFVLSEGDDTKNKITSSAIKTMISGVISFFETNEFDWNPKRVLKSIPREDRILGGKLSATNNDVSNMLNSTDILLEKTIIHFIASTGIRPGAISDPTLRMRHMIKIDDNCYAVTVYDESKEGYWAFLTPEASITLDRYIDQRKQKGEKITDESPIFRNKITDEIIPLSSNAARKIFYKLIINGGIKRIKTGNRYDKAVVTMFRKRFNGILKMNNDVNSNIAEKLMAHKRGLDGTYLAPTKDECFNEFKKAISILTVDPAERQSIEIKNKNKEITELHQEKKLRIDVQKQLDEMNKKQDEFQKMWIDKSFPGINN